MHKSPRRSGLLHPASPIYATAPITRENPLQNFKTLYGTGALRLNDQTHRLERVGGVSYTVKDGIVFDAKKLLADVADMVAAEKKKQGLPDLLIKP